MEPEHQEGSFRDQHLSKLLRLAGADASATNMSGETLSFNNNRDASNLRQQGTQVRKSGDNLGAETFWRHVTMMVRQSCTQQPPA